MLGVDVCQDGPEQTCLASESAHRILDVDFISVKDDRTRLLSLILIMATVSLVVSGIAIYTLYRAAIEGQRERLVETAHSQARLIEAIARYNCKHGKDVSGGPAKATLGQIIDAHEHYCGFGETGEFTLARLEGDLIIFLLSHRHDDLDNPRPIHFDSELAEPMHRALSGQSGTVVGLDYRGEVVLAAFEPVSELDLGIVAKIDLAEIREPFVTASLLALGSALLVILLGSVLFVRITNPVIIRLQDSYERAQRELAERQRAEEATQAAQQELSERQRNEKKLVEEELDKVKSELVSSARLATIGKISAQIAHDLRNPLGSIRNAAFYLRGMVSEFEGDSADELDVFLRVVEDEVYSCSVIIHNLLDTANPKKAVLETVDLGQLVQAAFTRADLPSGVRCQLESVPDPYIVRVDPNQWKQVADNLLANSLHAVGDSGTIEFRAVRSDEYDEMTIRDSGPGVSLENRESIFDVLFTTKAKGNGLGLAICRQIVEGHNGTIELAKPQNGGATFVIRLPRKQ